MIRKKGKVNIIVEKTDTGFSAYAENYPVFTTGKTTAELLRNVKEALNLYLEEEGVYVNQENIKLNIDFRLFFQHYKVLNAKFLAKRIGMNPTLLSQYVQGKKSPSTEQANRILSGIHEIGKELSELNLMY
jgi:predicted RNase H-like HicB family nuclease